MNANKTFVVVDLETTGQSVARGGRIIQIGMTFIKNRRIIDHFESFVDPGQPIDRNIQQLTHISEKDVRDAPYFEEIAPVLRNMLQDTVLIAHNINFDYPYLNDELARTGFPVLNNPAIDTVQLAQILLPTAPGYRLLDLTTFLNITLNNAHRANADAQATALLFLKLWQKAEQLPVVVLQQLQFGQWPLLRQTQDFLRVVKSKRQLADFDIVAQVAVTKPDPVPPMAPATLPAYPQSSQEKQQQFGQWLTSNEAQNDLMNRVYAFLTKKTDGVLTVLTAPKIGKTLGYLVPLIFDPQARPIVLLTNDDSLQQQQQALVEKIAKLLAIHFTAAILHDPSAYIDVERFNQLLKTADDTSPAQFFKARILVWLTQTQTGLLNEIQVGATNLPILDELRGNEQGIFYQRAQRLVNRAEVLTMNFETYFNQAQPLLVARERTKWPVVVMETPSAFVDELSAHYRAQLNLTDIKNSLKGLMHQEVAGLTHKQRLFVKQSVAEALKLVKQILQTDKVATQLKRAERLLMIIMRLMTILDIGEHGVVPASWATLPHELTNIKRLQQEPVVTVQDQEHDENGQTQLTRTFFVPVATTYQTHFLAHIHKLLVVSEYLDNQVSAFLREVPEQMTAERDFIHHDNQPVTVIQMGRTSPVTHLQALTQHNVGEIMMIVPDSERVNHWYQKLKHVLTTDYGLVAEGVTGSLEKIQRQRHTEQQNILIVTPKIMSTMWLRDQELPNIVIVPEREVWQPVSRLALVLTEMQRHPKALLVTQLNAMQRHRFKSQADIKANVALKNNLLAQYDQILTDF
ncbi:DNA polymerase III subunit epsilon [Leuconostoc lactis]|uniref:exonuclease domain-containing protein n=1 Tax=Leuconostoc lactis TaxID=1246 RepID=UPI0011BBBDD9|nr:exonuclease domain-containing protein [Leuconostoc lactis]QEA47736.1 DNA polymerase III subunit epsilon [Leuconostoc lactis]